jgi:adenylate kinase family enzyme
MNKPQTLIFIGRSGSGKGTQIDILKNYITEKNPSIGTCSFVMGNAFRSFMKEEGYAQDAIRSIVNSGKLVPDSITNSLFVSELLHNLKSNDHLYIDGIPRSPLQAETVIEVIKFYERANPIIINIEVSAEEVEKRMILRARPDDTKEAIVERLKFYEENIIPAIHILKEKSGFVYIEIDGGKSPEEVNVDLINKLNPYLN